jgi:Hydantoinase B/oxoprolinase
MDKDPSAIERVAFKVPPPHSKQRLLEPSGAATPRRLAVDVGGSHVKATLLSADGTGLTDEVQIATPHPCPPAALLIPDTGGAGRWRGGCGIRKDIELLNSTAVLSQLGDRHVFQPYGIFGGKPGALAQSVLNPQGNGERLHSKETRQIKRGDILSFRLSGAGGYGAPAERDPTAIARDVAEGYVSKQAALRDYGWSAAGED